MKNMKTPEGNQENHYTAASLRLVAAKRDSITHAGAATMHLNAAIPLRSAHTELQSTLEWQHTTVGHIL